MEIKQKQEIKSILFISDKNYHDKRKIKSLIQDAYKICKQEDSILKIITFGQTNFDRYIKQNTLSILHRDGQKNIMYVQYTRSNKVKSIYCNLSDKFYRCTTYRQFKIANSIINKIAISSDIILFLLYNAYGIETQHIKQLYKLCKKKKIQYNIMVQNKL